MSVYDSMTPAERSLRAKQAALTMWATTPDRTARTAKMRAAADARFEKQVDPDGLLPTEERAKRAEMARRAHMAAMSREAAKKRRKAKP